MNPYLIDDAYYYFVIARHMAAGEGPTFDGLHYTSGFHPLWLFICTGIALMVHDPYRFIVVITGLCLALHGGSCWLFYRLLRPYAGRYAPLAFAFAPNLWLMALSGMEFALAMFLLLALINLVEAR